MNFKIRLSLLLILIFSNLSLIPGNRVHILYGQQGGKISGRVTDKQTGRPLPDTNIEIAGTVLGTAADSTGYYAIDNLTPGTYTLIVSRIGYQTITLSITIGEGENRHLDFVLEPRAIPLDEVRVQSERLWEKYLNEAALVSVKPIRRRQIFDTPAAFDDALRVLQIKGGVTGAGDYSSFFSVQGGSPHQNLILQDGAILSFPYRFRAAFGGGLSDLNAHLIENLYLHLGGFSAEFGNALSSVVEIETRSGNFDRFQFQTSINLTDLNGLIEGPLPGVQGSYLLSLRRTYYDFIANNISQNNYTFPFYFEALGKFTWQISPASKMSLLMKQSREGLNLGGNIVKDLNIQESTHVQQIIFNLESLLLSRIISRATFAFSRDKTQYEVWDVSGVDSFQFVDLKTSLTGIYFKYVMRFNWLKKNWLNWGFNLVKRPNRVFLDVRETQFFTARFELPTDINYNSNYTNVGAFLEFSSNLLKRLHLRLGGRFDYSTLNSEKLWSPRFSFSLNLFHEIWLEGAGGKFYQFPEPYSTFLRDPAVDLSARPQTLKAEEATHLVLGLKKMFPAGWQFKIMAYRKIMEDLLIPTNSEDYSPRNFGEGISQGLEFELEKAWHPDSRWNLFLNYVWSRSKYRDRYTNDWIPFLFDRLHSFTFYLSRKLVGNWGVNLLGQAAGGFPFTSISGVLVHQHNTELIRAKKNSSRFPPYYRLDFRLTYHKRSKTREFTFYLDLINVFNRKNLYDIIWTIQNTGGSEKGTTLKRRALYMLPFIPSFGISLKL